MTSIGNKEARLNIMLQKLEIWKIVLLFLELIKYKMILRTLF